MIEKLTEKAKLILELFKFEITAYGHGKPSNKFPLNYFFRIIVNSDKIKEITTAKQMNIPQIG